MEALRVKHVLKHNAEDTLLDFFHDCFDCEIYDSLEEQLEQTSSLSPHSSCTQSTTRQTGTDQVSQNKTHSIPSFNNKYKYDNNISTR